jgi:hypothetical protein
VANTGGTGATLQAPIITGEPTDFLINANTCGTTLAPSTACSISIVFTPTASGARSAALSITDNAGAPSAATQTAQLFGIGDAPATDTLYPNALTFAQQQIGTTSALQQVTLSNTGGVALTLIAASVSPGDFSVVNACGNSLAAHSSCVFNITFAPTAIGIRTATLTITDQFHSQIVTLTGSGIAGPGVSLSPVLLNFLPTGVGLTAIAQTLTLSNNGGLPLTITNLAVTPGFNLAANTCGTTLAVNAACTLTVVFAPTTPGLVSGALTFTDNAPAGIQTTNLSGTGIDFSLTDNGSTTLTLAGTGASGSYPMLLSSLDSLSGNVALSCTGAPANSTCLVSPSIAPLGGTTTISVTVETNVPLAALKEPARPFAPRSLIVVALLLPLALVARRRRYVRLTLALALTCAIGSLSGCGANRIIPGSAVPGGTAPTAPGTYTLTVTATSAGLNHSVNVALVVQ